MRRNSGGDVVAVLGAVVMVGGVLVRSWFALFLCFDSCPPNLQAATVRMSAVLLAPGLLISLAAWLSLLFAVWHDRSAGSVALVVLLLPLTLLLVEALSWALDGGILGGWLFPQNENELGVWATRGGALASALLALWPLATLVLMRRLRVSSSPASKAPMRPGARTLLGAGLGLALVLMVADVLLAMQAQALHFTVWQYSLINVYYGYGSGIEAHGSVTRPNLAVPGERWLIGDGVTVEAYDYPLTVLARSDARQISSRQLSATTPIHAFYSGRLIIVYAGSDAAALSAFRSTLGPEL